MNLYLVLSLITLLIITVAILTIAYNQPVENFSEYTSFEPVKEAVKESIKKVSKDISEKISQVVGNKVDTNASCKKNLYSDGSYHSNMCLLRRKDQKKMCNSIVGVAPFPQDSISNPQNFYKF